MLRRTTLYLLIVMAGLSASCSKSANSTSESKPVVSAPAVRSDQASVPPPPAVAAPPAAIVQPTAPLKPAIPVEASGPYHDVLALVVGNNAYAGMPNLAGAEGDAEAVAAVLRKKFGFKVKSLIGPAATATAIRGALAEMRGQVSASTDVIFYFAGHGLQKKLPLANGEKVARKTGFAVPYSPDPVSTKSDLEVLQRDALEMQAVVNDLAGWPARHRVVILDCCYSGFANKAGVVASLDDFDAHKVDQPTVQVITAGLEGQLSVENSSEHRGVFTMALVKVLEEDDLQTLLLAFMKVSQKVISSPEYLADRRSGYPQHRLMSGEGGEFVLLPLERQPQWNVYLKASDERKLYSSSQQSSYGASATSGEYKAVITRGGEDAEPVVLTPEDVKRHEARASLGDPISMAILTEYYGTQKDEAAKQKAHSYAVGGYDTGNPYGTFALGRAYEKGYGVEANPELGTELQKMSGLKDILEIVMKYRQLQTDLQQAKKGDISSMVKVAQGGGAILGRLRSMTGRLFTGDDDHIVSAGPKSIDEALEAGDVQRVTVKLGDWAKRLSKVTPQTPRQKELFDHLNQELAELQTPVTPLSKQMKAYEEGMVRVRPLAVSLASSIKAGSTITKDRADVSEAVLKGNVKTVVKKLTSWQGALKKLKPTTEEQKKLVAKLDDEITTLLVPVTPVSKQLEAYETGIEKLWAVSDAVIDEMAVSAEAAADK